MEKTKKTKDFEPVRKGDFRQTEGVSPSQIQANPSQIPSQIPTSATYMPNGLPAPAVMTSDEVAAFLRLDGTGQRALKYWRDTGQITGIRIGRRVRYTLDEVLRFLSQKTAKSRGVGYVSQRS